MTSGIGNGATVLSPPSRAQNGTTPRRGFVAWLPTGEYQPHRPLEFGQLKLVDRP